MNQLRCFCEFSAIVVLLLARPVIAVSGVRQIPYEPINDEAPLCRWQLENWRYYPTTSQFTGWCSCYHDRTLMAFFMTNDMPSKSECLGNCLMGVQSHSCFPPIAWGVPYQVMRQCCTQCGGDLQYTINSRRTYACSPKPLPTPSHTPAAPSRTPSATGGSLTLIAVDELLSPDRVLEILEYNTLSILRSPPLSDFLVSTPRVTGEIAVTSESSFFNSNPGQRFSLASILFATPSVSPNIPRRPRGGHIGSLPQQDGRHPIKVIDIVRMKYKCHAKQCGAQVAIYSENSMRPHLIGKAIDILRVKTPNFDSVFEGDRKRIQIVKKGSTKYSVFIPYKKAYLERIQH